MFCHVERDRIIRTCKLTDDGQQQIEIAHSNILSESNEKIHACQLVFNSDGTQLAVSSCNSIRLINTGSHETNTCTESLTCDIIMEFTARGYVKSISFNQSGNRFAYTCLPWLQGKTTDYEFNERGVFVVDISSLEAPIVWFQHDVLLGLGCCWHQYAHYIQDDVLITTRMGHRTPTENNEIANGNNDDDSSIDSFDTDYDVAILNSYVSWDADTGAEIGSFASNDPILMLVANRMRSSIICVEELFVVDTYPSHKMVMRDARTFEAHWSVVMDSAIATLNICGQGDRLVSVGCQRGLCVWDANTGAQLASFNDGCIKSNKIYRLSVNYDCSLCMYLDMSLTGDPKLVICDVTSGSLRQELPGLFGEFAPSMGVVLL